VRKLTHPEQLQIITSGRIYEAVEEHLAGDWSRRGELFDLPRALFDSWADALDISGHGYIRVGPATFDGIYIVPRGHRWCVYQQEKGGRDSERTFDDFRQAKRAAIAMNYLWCLELGD
jgi:hypothetical protein